MSFVDPARSAARLAGRHLGRYRAQVVDVDDPKGLGRVRVTVPEVLGKVETGWALPAFAASGDGSGIYAVPPVGAGVWVEFEAGDPSLPVWAGGWFAEGDVPGDATPNKLVIKTPAGHTITLDDGSGTVEIADSGGAKILLGSDGIALSKGSQKVTVGSSSVSINDGALEVM
jgi:uncharacterized protein involved in type VI secretion and phage assembly